MRPSELSQALESVLPSGRPAFVWGPPGCGKSSVVRAAAESLKLELTDLRATLLDPVDLRGLPRVSKGKSSWCPPEFLPTSGSGVLFLDELTQAAPSVQAACLQLVLDRRLGEYELPPGWVVAAASNRGEDRAGGHRLIAPLLNRFVHLELEADAADWQEWATSAGVAPEVRAFLRLRPNLLHPGDPGAEARAFPTPRTWQFASDLLARTPSALLHPVLSGCVGEGAAAEFLGFLRLYRELPDIDAALASPDTAPVPREPAVLYALAGALAEACKRASTPVANFVAYATRLPDEFALLALRGAVASSPGLATDPAVQRWIASARSRGLFAL